MEAVQSVEYFRVLKLTAFPCGNYYVSIRGHSVPFGSYFWRGEPDTLEVGDPLHLVASPLF